MSRITKSASLPVANVIIRGELFRHGGRLTRVSSGSVQDLFSHPVSEERLVDRQNDALDTLVDQFVVPSRAHFSIRYIVFDVTIANKHLPKLLRIVRRLHDMGYTRKQVKVYIRSRSEGTQLENIAIACQRPPVVRNTFVLRGDTHFLRPFPFDQLTDRDAFYVLNRMPALPSDGPKQYRVVDTFWYVPKRWYTTFEHSLHANWSKERSALHNFYWRRLPAAGVPNEALRILQPDIVCEPAVTPIMFIVNRPIRADHLALVDQRTRQRLAKLHVEVVTRRPKSHKRTHRPRASKRRARHGRGA